MDTPTTMDATATYLSLRSRGITLVVSDDRDRLHAHPAAELDAELATALAGNHDRLLREELLREILRFVCDRLHRNEGGSYTPAASAALGSMANGQERIADAMDHQDLEHYKQALHHWARTALHTYKNATARDPATTQDVRHHEQRDSVTGPQHPAQPVQEELFT